MVRILRTLKMENKNTEIFQGVVHEIPEDMCNRILSDETLLSKWNSLTPLARNEWICWVTAVKRAETREQHIDRLHSDLLNGKRRPCCWPGCKHR